MTTIDTVAVDALDEDDAAVAERLIRFARDIRPELIARQAESEATTYIP